MKVGILGSGNVAKALAGGFLRHGHEIMLGTRTPSNLSDWTDSHPGSHAASVSKAAAFGELIVFAVKGTAALSVLRAAGAENLSGKTVIDVTNPIADAPPENGVLKFFTRLDESLMEKLQHEFPEAHLVKAFNSVGNALMVNPRFKEGMPTMFICGNNKQAKEMVGEICKTFGWDVADMGSVEAARAIEPLCMLWCIPGFNQNDWTHAFKLLH